MPTKDKAEANEQAKLRMQRYRERRSKGLTVTPSEASEAVTPDLENVTPSVNLEPLGELGIEEANAITADLPKTSKVQKGSKIGYGLRYGKDLQAKGRMR